MGSMSCANEALNLNFQTVRLYKAILTSLGSISAPP